MTKELKFSLFDGIVFSPMNNREKTEQMNELEEYFNFLSVRLPVF
jgi:hypothetical protein